MTANKVGKRPPSIITVGDSSEPGETSIGLEDKEVPNDYGELFLSEDKQAPSTRKRKLKSQQSLCPRKRVATSLNMKSTQLSELKLATPLEIDTTQPSSSKVVKDLSQSRPALRETRLRFILPWSSEELDTHPLGDELNATSSRAHTEHQQPSEELYTKPPTGLQVAPSLPKENQLANLPSHESNPNELPNLPFEEPPHDEVIQFEWSSSRIQEDQRGGIVSQEPGSDWLPGVQNQEPPCLEGETYQAPNSVAVTWLNLAQPGCLRLSERLDLQQPDLM
ncbi:hypothetical protein PISMIDRAFT_15252 [Pisolithus microcarpus 441]|uniref:Uncharacterized protein n=1 Tax=Pisolithus microcarpus 441 TaxID=765257 RepID=A0A0C9YKW5_9AGAM|nr:hypothetical protein BKA83DRAFT_15252 [Pisolithus microcarpus]KIK17311.1 hypothetical protein PISMIDRAFT_15252 [Pisolithus microcarpus 441]